MRLMGFSGGPTRARGHHGRVATGLARCAAAAGLLAGGCAPRAPSGAADLRIVSLAPNLTEIVCAVGAGHRLAGRTSACTYPPEIVGRVPVIGGFGAPSVEAVLAARPSLVLETDLEQESVGHLIEQAGIRRIRLPCASLSDIQSAILAVGRLTDREPAGRTLAEGIRIATEARRAELEARRAAGHVPPSVFVELWDDPLITVGRGSFVSELIELAGGRNLGDEAAARDYFPVSSEWVLARNPDVVICLHMTDGGAEPAGALERVTGRIGWGRVSAARTGRIYGGLDNDLILRPGPRVIEGLAALRRCLETEGPAEPAPAQPREAGRARP